MRKAPTDDGGPSLNVEGRRFFFFADSAPQKGKGSTFFLYVIKKVLFVIPRANILNKRDKTKEWSA